MNATYRSGAGGIEVSPTSSLQLPAARTAARVPTPNTRRPRISSLLTVWEPHAQEALGLPAPRALFKLSFVIELSGRRQVHPAPQEPINQPVEPAVRYPQWNAVEPSVRGDHHTKRRAPGARHTARTTLSGGGARSAPRKAARRKRSSTLS